MNARLPFVGLVACFLSAPVIARAADEPQTKEAEPAANTAAEADADAKPAAAQDAPARPAPREPRRDPAPAPSAERPGWYEAVPGGLAQRPPRNPVPANVAQQASCVLQIDADTAYANPYGGYAGPAIDAATVAGLIHSTPVLDAAVKKAAFFPGAVRNWREWVVVNAEPTSQRFVRVEVSLLKGHPAELAGGDEDDFAGKLLTALTERLRATVKESVEGQRDHYAKRQAAMEKEVEQARQKFAAARDRLRKARAATGTLTSQYGSDPRSALAGLKNQKQSVEQQLNANRARLKALEPAATPLITELTQVVDLREKQLDELKASDNAAKDALAAAARKLSEARAQLEVARRAATSGDGSDARYRNSEAATLRINITESETRLKTLDEQIARLEDEKFVALLEELPELTNEENRLRSEVNDLTMRMDQFRRSNALAGEISIRVLDGEPEAEQKRG